MVTLEHRSSLITVTQEEMKKIRQFYGIDADRIKEDVKSIQDWVTKQEHLVDASEYLTKDIIERVLVVLSRGSVEETKKKIDRLLTTRGVMADLSLHRTLEEFKPLWNNVLYVPLPKLHPVDQTRVMVTQFIADSDDDFNILTYFRYSFMIGEYRLHFDYSLGDRFVIDLANIRLGYLSKLNPIIIKKSEILCTEGFGAKIKGIHLLNAPPFVDKVVFILKQALREKVASRLHVHNSYEEFYEHIPRQILPKDYGGDVQSCSKLAEQWKTLIQQEETKQIMKNWDKLVTDESKRSSMKFNEEYLGMPGSFRKLTVD